MIAKQPDTSLPAIKVEGLGKCYHLYEKPVSRVIDLISPGPAKRYKPFWALRNASFEIEAGQTVGIIGRNGSGKSTLLEIISNTLQLSEGKVNVNGRIAALLELGAGFNPDFTGRENVYMNAAIMGIDRAVIDDKFSEIEAFANIGDFINHPVSTYSSGMYVRLAFATSIHMDPDILIVDEALAVGDIRFQRKCFREFERFKREGKTILFVTHAVELVRSYCDSAIFLHQGEIRRQGEPRDVVHDYLDMLFGSEEGSSTTAVDKDASLESGSATTVQLELPEQSGRDLNSNARIDGSRLRKSYNPSEYRWGEQQAQIIDYLLESGGEIDPVILQQGAKFKLTMRVYFHQPLGELIYGVTIKTLDGTTVYGANTRERGIHLSTRNKGEVADICFTLENNLVQGNYFVSLGVAQHNDTVDNLALDRRYDLFSIAVDGELRDFGLANLNMVFEESSV
jgi:lipopolysaccharide transport system ATP-binding protein